MIAVGDETRRQQIRIQELRFQIHHRQNEEDDPQKSMKEDPPTSPATEQQKSQMLIQNPNGEEGLGNPKLQEKRLSLWRPLIRPGIEPEIEREPVSKTIHILGLGAVGKYIAHNLAGQPDAPLVTLLMHRPLLMQQWHDEGAAIRLLKNGKIY